jgi:hypothetical protein
VSIKNVKNLLLPSWSSQCDSRGGHLPCSVWQVVAEGPCGQSRKVEETSYLACHRHAAHATSASWNAVSAPPDDKLSFITKPQCKYSSSGLAHVTSASWNTAFDPLKDYYTQQIPSLSSNAGTLCLWDSFLLAHVTSESRNTVFNISGNCTIVHTHLPLSCNADILQSCTAFSASRPLGREVHLVLCNRCLLDSGGTLFMHNHFSFLHSSQFEQALSFDTACFLSSLVKSLLPDSLRKLYSNWNNNVCPEIPSLHSSIHSCLVCHLIPFSRRLCDLNLDLDLTDKVLFMFAFNWKLIIYYLKTKQNYKTNQSNCFCGNVTYIFFLITHSLVIKIRKLPSFSTLHLVNEELYIYLIKTNQAHKTNQSNCFCGNVTYISLLIFHSLVIKIRLVKSILPDSLRKLYSNWNINVCPEISSRSLHSSIHPCLVCHLIPFSRRLCDLDLINKVLFMFAFNWKLIIYYLKIKQNCKTIQSNCFCGNVTYIFFLITHSLVIKIRKLPSFATFHLRTLVNEELFVYLIKTKQDETKQFHILTFDNVKFYTYLTHGLIYSSTYALPSMSTKESGSTASVPPPVPEHASTAPSTLAPIANPGTSRGGQGGGGDTSFSVKDKRKAKSKAKPGSATFVKLRESRSRMKEKRKRVRHPFTLNVPQTGVISLLEWRRAARLFFAEAMAFHRTEQANGNKAAFKAFKDLRFIGHGKSRDASALEDERFGHGFLILLDQDAQNFWRYVVHAVDIHRPNGDTIVPDERSRAANDDTRACYSARIQQDIWLMLGDTDAQRDDAWIEWFPMIYPTIRVGSGALEKSFLSQDSTTARIMIIRAEPDWETTVDLILATNGHMISTLAGEVKLRKKKKPEEILADLQAAKITKDLKTLAVHTPAGDDMEDEANLLASESDGEFSDGGTRKRPARFEANLSTHVEENKKSRSGGEAPVGENMMEEEEVETSNMEA